MTAPPAPYLGTFPFPLAPDPVPPPPDPGPPPVVAVVGDSFTAGYVWGGIGSANWTLLVRDMLRLAIGNNGTGGAGYVTPSWGTTFPHTAITAVPRDADAVVVFGGCNDQQQDPEAVRVAAVVTLTAARVLAPGAALLLVGPQWAATPVPPRILAMRDPLRAAAVACGATYTDPTSWLLGRHDLIGPDGLHPTDAGHALLAQRLAPLIAAALPPPAGGTR